MSETYVITGASDGVGAAAARLLHATRPDDRMVVVGRSPEKTRAVGRELGTDYFTADFSELDQVRALAEELSQLGPIRGLANNAGGLFDTAARTVDGYERTWQVNVVAPFLLTALLKDQLRGPESVVVNTSSIAANLLARFDADDPNTLKSSPLRLMAMPNTATSYSRACMPTTSTRWPFTLVPSTNFPNLRAR